MNNTRISKKERNLIKGAIRRVFSRSDLRRAVIEASKIEHSDPSRPRVKTWCECALCKQPKAKSDLNVDHIDPIIPVTTTLEEMSWDLVIDRIWCEKNNLQAICKDCHDEKTASERKQRKRTKK